MTKTSKESRKEFKKQAAELIKDEDDKVHYANPKMVYLTLCGRPISSTTNQSPLKKDITCDGCKNELSKGGTGLPFGQTRRA
jgi:hypothetical protein